MVLPNIFNKTVSDGVIERINKLKPDLHPGWGKMTVAQMLAHCNVTYEMLYDNKHPKPNAFMRFMIKMMAKETVVGEKPYKKNSRTAPAFVMTGNKNFDQEKQRLIAYLNRTQVLGENHFDGKESLSFGKLSIAEWNNMFYKHLDHHLTQFGV